MTAETIWQSDWPESGYHDAMRCRCDGHCRNCFEDLDAVRAQINSMIERGVVGPNGPYTDADRLHPLARYCSGYCRSRAKRERAIDRFLAAQDVGAR